jgi:hypothetical protein
VKKLINSFKRRKELAIITAFLSIVILLSVSPAAATVSDWEFSPQKLVSGDFLNLQGSASPGEKIDVSVNFEKTVPISGGKYEYVLEDVKIPDGFSNSFKVEATGAKNLNVRVKMGIWVTKSSEASGDTAIVSQSNVPPGTYTIKIDGDAGEGVSEVNLKISASQKVEANSNGDFSYSYNTKAVPSGDFEVKVGGITKEITIEPKEISGSSSESSTGSSSTGSPSTGSSSTGSSSTGSPSTGSSSESSTKYSSTGSSSIGSSHTKSASAVDSSSVKTGSSIEPTTPKTLEGKGVSEASNLNSDVKEKDTQKPVNGGDVQSSKSSQSLNMFYLLTGIGVAILFLVLYSIKK